MQVLPRRGVREWQPERRVGIERNCGRTVELVATKLDLGVPVRALWDTRHQAKQGGWGISCSHAGWLRIWAL